MCWSEAVAVLFTCVLQVQVSEAAGVSRARNCRPQSTTWNWSLVSHGIWRGASKTGECDKPLACRHFALQLQTLDLHAQSTSQLGELLRRACLRLVQDWRGRSRAAACRAVTRLQLHSAPYSYCLSTRTTRSILFPLPYFPLRSRSIRA